MSCSVSWRTRRLIANWEHTFGRASGCHSHSISLWPDFQLFPLYFCVLCFILTPPSPCQVIDPAESFDAPCKCSTVKTINITTCRHIIRHSLFHAPLHAYRLPLTRPDSAPKPRLPLRHTHSQAHPLSLTATLSWSNQPFGHSLQPNLFLLWTYKKYLATHRYRKERERVGERERNKNAESYFNFQCPGPSV